MKQKFLVTPPFTLVGKSPTITEEHFESATVRTIEDGSPREKSFMLVIDYDKLPETLTILQVHNLARMALGEEFSGIVERDDAGEEITSIIIDGDFWVFEEGERKALFVYDHGNMIYRPVCTWKDSNLLDRNPENFEELFYRIVENLSKIHPDWAEDIKSYYELKFLRKNMPFFDDDFDLDE